MTFSQTINSSDGLSGSLGVDGLTIGLGGSFGYSEVNSNSTSITHTGSQSLSVSFGDPTINPGKDEFVLLMNVPVTVTTRGTQQTSVIQPSEGTPVLLLAEQLEGLAQGNTSLFTPGELADRCFVGSSLPGAVCTQTQETGGNGLTLTQLIQPSDAAQLLLLDAQLQGVNPATDTDRFEPAFFPATAGPEGGLLPDGSVPTLPDGGFNQAVVTIFPPAPLPADAGSIPQAKVTVQGVTALGATTSNGVSTTVNFQSNIGLKGNIGIVSAGLTNNISFSETYSKVIAQQTTNSLTAGVGIGTNNDCFFGTVAVYLDEAFGSYITVPNIINSCVQTEDILSFESLADWTVGGNQGGSATLSTTALTGNFSFDVVGTNWTTLASVPLSAQILQDIANSNAVALAQAADEDAGVTDAAPVAVPNLAQVSYALEIPTTQPNPSWTGNTQMYMSSPSSNVYNAYLGQVQLTGIPQGSFQRMEFTVPDYALPALQGTATDVTFTIVLNVEPDVPGWLIDDLEIGE